jgi:hypothetical protein
MTFTGVFVDDEDEEYADQLTTLGQLDIEFLPVDEVTALATAIIARSGQFAALDYRLDESVANLRADQTFKGSALAQHLRDKAIEVPATDLALVLVSAEANVRTLYRPDKTAHDLFDRVYIKEEINAQRARIRREVLSLATAYETLRKSALPYDLAALTKAQDGDREVLDSQDIRLKVQEAKAPHLLVRAVFALLIDRTGPLMDLDDVCALFGLDRSFGAVLEPHLAGGRYEGLFGDAWPRWWTNRIETLGQEVFKRRPTGLRASDRAAILSEAFGVALKPAVSPWTRSPHELIAVACACCRRGVEIAHTVAIFEAALPKVLARRRICWDCVQTDAHLAASPPLIIDEIDESLAQEVRVMARPAAPNEAGA